MTTLLSLLWLAVPIIAAGLVHLAVMKLDLLPALRRSPMDFGLTFRGRRLFGANKTWRGAIVTIATTSLAAWLLAQLILRLVSAAARLTSWFSSGFVCAALLLAQISKSVRTHI